MDSNMKQKSIFGIMKDADYQNYSFAVVCIRVTWRGETE